MANATNNSSSTLTDGVLKFSLVIYCVIFVVGLLGNGLVIYVTGFRMKKTVNSVWFLNLALADFLFTAFLIFSIISTSQNHQWPFGRFMCKLNSFVSLVNMFASVFLLMAISLDRCLSIWVVVWAQNKRTVRKAQLITAVVWVTAVVCSAPAATFRETLTFKDKTYCTYPFTTPLQTLNTFRFVLGFLLPFLVIFVSYVAIAVRAGRLQRTRRQRCRRMIFSVIVAFFLCWLPFHIMTFINVENSNIIRMAGSVSLSLAYLNSCMNPILYVFMCDEFQKKLKQSICFVLESALAEDHLSFMSSRSLSSHLSRFSRKSESGSPSEKMSSATPMNFTGSKVVVTEVKEILSTD
ncbi:chemerin-like receptor 1 [Channa argus]|uniref:chemerin-like receptor 1 n=1 Tax=Channa argus TaxID=215402 RepID=UPI0029440785|nr:hypothetical protein Q8A73_008095 [Channa argus]